MLIAGRFGDLIKDAPKVYQGYQLAGGDTTSELLARIKPLAQSRGFLDSSITPGLQMMGFNIDDVMYDRFSPSVMSALVPSTSDSDRRAFQTFRGAEPPQNQARKYLDQKVARFLSTSPSAGMI
ncbi:MAG: hypothetical protein Tp158DCM1229571_39 [Prokaryotic dsDNA virus sp.]|nr:MAG: hypothetical protein Tp158DCM1229571_39 [Prokaryotic dsDNA virus sp.]|tara:strand:+ start:115 stop:486 length:372 start_codon:yes stop_codon:yes gene_type:complete